MIEVEKRYKVHDVKAMIDLLARRGIKVSGEKRIVDKWHVPETVHSQKEQDVWYDDEHGIAYRIRRTFLPDGSSSLVLDSKQLTDHNNHDTFKEEIIMEDDLAAMESFLKTQKYYNWLTLDKIRHYFDAPMSELTISMDTVAGIKDRLGVDTVLEIEFSGDGTRDDALATIESLTKELGLQATDQFDKSLTVESMRVLARFR